METKNEVIEERDELKVKKVENERRILELETIVAVSTYAERFESLDNELRNIDESDMEAGIRMLDKGRRDTLYYAAGNLRSSLKEIEELTTKVEDEAKTPKIIS